VLIWLIRHTELNISCLMGSKLQNMHVGDISNGGF
jgi:hypothetical protein